MTKFLRIPLTALLLAGVFCAQWLAVVPALPALAHAPQHECAQHRCGCPAEMVARKMCCCFRQASVPQGIVGTLIRSVQCGGDSSPQTMVLAKLDWALPAFAPVIVAAGLSEIVADLQKTFSIRVVEPAIPPPKSPLCFL